MLENVKLYRHQEETIRFYEKNPYCMNWSEPGTGKSITAIAAMEGKGSCLVVCPAFLTRNWVEEIEKFTGEKAAIWPKTARITVQSVDSLYKDSEPFKAANVVVLDEFHTINNPTSRRSSTFFQYVQNFKPRQLIMMSGTPMRNRVPELFVPLSLMDLFYKSGFRLKFPSTYSFNMNFCFPIERRIGSRFVTQYEGVRNADYLKQLLAPLHIKFSLEELEDLPDIVFEEVVIPVKKDLGVTTLDRELEAGWQDMELGKPPPSHISTLKKMSAIDKVLFGTTYVRSLIDAGSGPIVVFSDHVDPCKLIAAEIDDAEYITGETPMVDRNNIIRRFQAGKIPVLAGTIGAMSTGVTLTASNTLIFLDKSWVPSNNHQAYHRIHRVSQKRRCRVISIVREGVDQRIVRALTAKEATIHKVLEEDKTLEKISPRPKVGATIRKETTSPALVVRPSGVTLLMESSLEILMAS